MKNLVVPPSTIAYSQRHIDVVSSKRNTIKGSKNKTKKNLLQLESRILNRYSLFEQAVKKKALFNFPKDPSLIIHREDLLSCYSGRTAKVKEIFSIIEGAQQPRFLKRCPYCGITLPKTFDHYLPESKFPELVLHALNLIPCCGTCNQVKNDNWKNATHRTFLYLYSDKIPVSQYLSVSLHSLAGVTAVGAEFSINKPESSSSKTWSVLAAHYEKLNLISSYNNLASDEISEVFNVCVSHLMHGGHNIKDFLSHLVSTEEQLYGSNHWRVVLMKALSTSQNFYTAVCNASLEG